MMARYGQSVPEALRNPRQQRPKRPRRSEAPRGGAFHLRIPRVIALYAAASQPLDGESSCGSAFQSSLWPSVRS
jgi:hypothetical protein